MALNAKIALIAVVAAPVFFVCAAEMRSVRAPADTALDTHPDSAFWKSAAPVLAKLDNKGKPLPEGFAVEVRSHWTVENLYFLFQCPYEELFLRPNPTTKAETYELWNWDVAEVFIGSDFGNIRRYKEFEVSPQGEWVDLDIDLSKPHHEDGWLWNSGFESAARVDQAAKMWYAAMRIPFRAISPNAPKQGARFRVNLYVSEGPPSNHLSIAWQPTLTKTFHTPERFGTLVLASSRTH